MSVSRSAPLYLFFGIPAFQKQHHDDEEMLRDGGFEDGVVISDKVDDNRSDVSAYADEMLPLKLPPRLHRLASSSGSTTSPLTVELGRSMLSWSAFTSSGRRRRRGFDPFAAALEKVRMDGAARSWLSPQRCGGVTAAVGSGTSRPAAGATASAARRSRSRRGVNVKHFFCSAAWPRCVDGGAAAA